MNDLRAQGSHRGGDRNERRDLDLIVARRSIGWPRYSGAPEGCSFEGEAPHSRHQREEGATLVIERPQRRQPQAPPGAAAELRALVGGVDAFVLHRVLGRRAQRPRLAE